MSSRTGKPVDSNQGTAVPLGFVLQHPAERGPGSVLNGVGEGAIRQHPAHAQILDRDHLVFANQPSGEFVQEIMPPIRHTCVCARQANLGLEAATT